MKLFPSARVISSLLSEGEVRFELDAERLTEQELGRLVLLNGKRRAEGTRFTLCCPASLVSQLIDLDLHRILWVEKISCFNRK